MSQCRQRSGQTSAQVTSQGPYHTLGSMYQGKSAVQSQPKHDVQLVPSFGGVGGYDSLTVVGNKSYSGYGSFEQAYPCPQVAATFGLSARQCQ